MPNCETCFDHDRPEILLSQAMAQARVLAELMRGDAALLMDERTRSLTRTIGEMADARRIADERCTGPFLGLIERLDRVITASMRPVRYSSVVGTDENGEILETLLRDEPDPSLAPLVTLRDRAREVLEMVERVRDAVAADEAVMQMRRAAT